MFPDMAILASSKCNIICTDGSKCGGLKGAISAYKYHTKSTLGISILLKDKSGLNATARTLATGEVVYLDVAIGSHTCTAFGAVPNIGCVFAGLKLEDKISVDYGDGSGATEWMGTSDHNLWAHMYTTTGKFLIFVESNVLWT